jgi:polysaccharide transporter, PST family
MSLIRTLRLGATGKEALGNTVWVLAEKVIRLGVGFVVMAWVARYVGPRDFGLLSYCTAIVGLLSFLPSLGLDAVVRSDLAAKAEDHSSLLSTAARLRLLGALLAVGLLVLLVALVGNRIGHQERWLLLILGFSLFQPALFVPELYFQAIGQTRYSTWAQIAAVLSAAVMRLMLIGWSASLLWFGAAVLVEMVLGWLLLAWFARRRQLRWWSVGFDARIARRLLDESWPLLLAGVAVLIYMKIDLVMLRQLSGEEEAGVYSAAVRISEGIYFVPTAIVMGLLALWSAARQAGGPDYARQLQRIYDLQALAAYGFAIPVALAAPWLIVHIFGPDYSRAAPVLSLHVWATLFVFTGVVRSQAWVFENLNRLTLWTTLAGAVCNVVLNFWLIPAHGAVGAAAATIVSYALAAWASSFLFTRTRHHAWMQTKALLLPITGWRYLWSR